MNENEIARYRRFNTWRVQWYVRDGTIRQMWFRTLKEARIEAEKHRDAEVFKELLMTVIDSSMAGK
jgi:hypothetical protein